MVLKSSDRDAPLVDPARLPDGLGWSIDDRLRSAGAAKGRVIGIWQGATLVAACAWHLHESGPPVIFDLGCRVDLPKAQADRGRMALLACLRDIAEALGRDTDSLRWCDWPLDRIPDRDDKKRIRGAVRKRAGDLKFDRLRPRPKWLKGRWA